MNEKLFPQSQEAGCGYFIESELPQSDDPSRNLPVNSLLLLRSLPQCEKQLSFRGQRWQYAPAAHSCLWNAAPAVPKPDSGVRVSLSSISFTCWRVWFPRPAALASAHCSTTWTVHSHLPTRFTNYGLVLLKVRFTVLWSEVTLATTHAFRDGWGWCDTGKVKTCRNSAESGGEVKGGYKCTTFSERVLSCYRENIGKRLSSLERSFMRFVHTNLTHEQSSETAKGLNSRCIFLLADYILEAFNGR